MRRRFRPLRTWRFWAGWAILLFALVRILYLARSNERPRAIDEGMYQVAFVIDGDTLVLDDGTKVRLIGVDTPETGGYRPAEAWGPEATALARQFIDRVDGEVRLQFDDERLDKYGRQLAYVWCGDRLLNEELIRAGLGEYLHGFHYSATMKRRFHAAENEARTARAGMWRDR
jgi:micrococcal nuclease